MLGCFKVGGFGKDGLECWRLFFGEGFLVVGSFGALGVFCFGGGCSGGTISLSRLRGPKGRVRRALLVRGSFMGD